MLELCFSSQCCLFLVVLFSYSLCLFLFFSSWLCFFQKILLVALLTLCLLLALVLLFTLVLPFLHSYSHSCWPSHIPLLLFSRKSCYPPCDVNLTTLLASCIGATTLFTLVFGSYYIGMLFFSHSMPLFSHWCLAFLTLVHWFILHECLALFMLVLWLSLH